MSVKHPDEAYGDSLSPGVDRIRASTVTEWQRALREIWFRVDAILASYREHVSRFRDIGADHRDWEFGRQHAEISLPYLIRELLGEEHPDPEKGIATRIAESWVDRGLPLDPLMQRVTLHQRVLWEALLNVGDESTLPMLATHASDLWETVHLFSVDVQRAYSEAAAEAARDNTELQRQYLARLMGGVHVSAQQLDHSARALDLDAQAVFVVIAGQWGDRERIRTMAQQVERRRNERCFLHEDGEHVVVLMTPPPVLTNAFTTQFEGTRCVISPVAHGVADVPERARVVRRLADVAITADVEGLLRLGDLAVPLALTAFGEVTELFRDDVLGTFARRSDPERERIIETLEAYIATGSIAETAAQVYCHRNTVVNRLRIFRRTTGYDVTVPRHAAAVALALAAR